MRYIKVRFTYLLTYSDVYRCRMAMNSQLLTDYVVRCNELLLTKLLSQMTKYIHNYARKSVKKPQPHCQVFS